MAEHDESDIRQIMGNGKVAPSSAYCRYKSIAVVDAAAALDVVPAKKVDARFARRVVEEAYTLWRTEHAQARGDVSLIDFDHAIWLYDRGAGQQAKPVG